MRAYVVVALAALVAGCAPQTVIANNRQTVIEAWSPGDAVQLATKECGARGRWPLLLREQGDEYWFSCNETEQAIAARRKAEEEEVAKRAAAFRAAQTSAPAAVAPVSATTAAGKDGAVVKKAVAAKTVSEPRVFAKGAWVQIGAFRSKTVAKRYIREIRAAHGGVIKGHDVVLREKMLGKRGQFTLVRLGPFTRMADARHVCDALKRRGAPCFVVRVR